MNIKEGVLLIAQLLKENETNSPEDREFNNKLIKLIKEGMVNALSDKKTNKNKQ